ncbi:uncharacterized protein LOC144701270 isoform X2 [Wolffia australiana]
MHTANVIHRDLTPENVLANSDCKLKISNFSYARASFNDATPTLFWNDDGSKSWYRAPELCGSFFAEFSPKSDLWSVGCIFAEMLMREPLFPGRNMFHQLDLITNLLGTPSSELIARVRSVKARRYLSVMKSKDPKPMEGMFPGIDPLAICLLERLLAFDPHRRPSAEEALTDPYFFSLGNIDREPAAQPISKVHFEFESRKMTKQDIRELVYREILEYHPRTLQKFLSIAANRKKSSSDRNVTPSYNNISGGKIEKSVSCSLAISSGPQHDKGENARMVHCLLGEFNQAQNLSENGRVKASNVSKDASLEISMQGCEDASCKSHCDGWHSILKETDKLDFLSEKSSHVTSSRSKADPRKVYGGNRGRAKPRFSIRFPSVVHTADTSENRAPSVNELGYLGQENQPKHSAPSMTQLLEELSRQGLAAPLEERCSRHFSLSVRRNKKRGREFQDTTSMNATARSLKNLDSPEHVVETSSEEDDPEKSLIPVDEDKGQTMANLFQEVFNVSIADVGGLPIPMRSSGGLAGRLQRIIQREKERHIKVVKQIENNQVRGFNVKLLSRVLDAKSIVCRCLLYDRPAELAEGSQNAYLSETLADIGDKTERTIIFNPKICENVELEIGNLVCIYPPWKEVKSRDGDITVLCSYFTQLMP